MEKWIALDCRMLRHTGIGTYIRTLVPYLPAPPSGHRYLTILTSGQASLGDLAALEVPLRPLSPGDQILPWYLRRREVPLLFVPHFNAPVTWRGRLAVTIHDLIPLVVPNAVTPVKRAIFGLWLKAVVARADAILTDSDYGRLELVRRVGVAPPKITVVAPAVGPQFRPASAEERGPAGGPGSGPRFLYVGRAAPHKNLTRLLHAFSKVAGRLRDSTLVMVGFSPPTRLVEETARLGLTGRVHFASYIDEETLLKFYRASTALVLPSLYEGFGLPALEAMACGTPVIASNRTALPEVIGEAGILVEPEDADGIAGAMLTVAQDRDLWRSLHERGLVQASRFSPQASAARMAAVFQRLVEGPGS